MTNRIAYPFLTLDDSTVQAERWQIFLNGNVQVGADGYIADWDYASTIRIARRLVIDVPAAAQQLAIPQNVLSVSVIVRIGTGKGAFPRTITKLGPMFPEKSNGSVVIDHSVSGAMLSHRLKLTTDVILNSWPGRGGALSPRSPASRLWKDEEDLQLEGDEPRFPMEAISFQKAFGENAEASSLWYLQWSPTELSRDFRGAVRLYLNADRGDFMEKIAANDRATLQLVSAGVIGQMVERALLGPDSTDEIESCPEGSVGACVQAWLSSAFPGQPIKAIRSTLEQTPGRFHAALQGLSDVAGEVE